MLGHELVVEVLDAPGAPQWVGKRAVVEPLIRCGTCRACRLGRYNCCSDLKVMGVHVDGGLRERMAVGIEHLHEVPEDMPDEVAVLAEPTTIAYHAVLRSEIAAGQTAVVFGQGPIGLLVTALLHRRDCRVIAVDVDRARLEVARTFGAAPVHSGEEDVVRAVAAQTGGEMADVVFEATGHPACTRMTTNVAAHAGRIVLIGWNKGPVEIDTVTLMRKEVDLLGSRNSRNAFPAVLRLLSDRVVDPGSYITHRFRFDEAVDAVTLLDTGAQPAVKVVIDAQL